MKKNIPLGFLFLSASILLFFNDPAAASSRKTQRPRCSVLDANTLSPVLPYNPIRNGAVINLAKLPAQRALICSAPQGATYLLRRGRVIQTVSSDAVEISARLLENLNTVPTKPGRYSISTRTKPTSSCSTNFSVIDTAPPETQVRPPPQIESIPIPRIEQWQTNMLSYGQRYCDRANILNLSTWEGSVWYYDGINVYQQIAQYTGDNSWYQCADYVKEVYRGYVLANNGRVGGWRVFAKGLAQDWLRNHDELSRQAVLQLVSNSPFAPQGGGADPELSRETAYLILADIAAMQVGAARPQNLNLSVQYALGHLTKWQSGETSYVKPFMVALTLEALIDYSENIGDSRILPAVRQAADWMWSSFWQASERKFPYIVCDYPSVSSECTSSDNTGSADLSLLIAPAYAWLYSKTGESKYQIAGDQIFAGGVDNAWLGAGKTFSQNYRSSFGFIRWRSSAAIR